MNHVKGKWVLFADADDFFVPEWIKITDRYLDVDADVVQFRIDDLLARTDCLWHNQVLNEFAKGKKSAREALFSNITCWAKMFSFRFLRQNNILFEEVQYGNDVAFGYQIAVKAQIIVISPYPIYDVTYREGSLTTIKNRESAWIRYTTVKRANTYAVEHGCGQYELPHAIEVLKTWRGLGLRDYLHFIWHERHEIARASKVRIEPKPFNHRHPFLYVLLVLLKLV